MHFNKILKYVGVSFLYGVNRYAFANKDFRGNYDECKKNELITTTLVDGIMNGVNYVNPVILPTNLIKLISRIEIKLSGKDKTKYSYIYMERGGRYNYNTF